MFELNSRKLEIGDIVIYKDYMHYGVQPSDIGIIIDKKNENYVVKFPDVIDKYTKNQLVYVGRTVNSFMVGDIVTVGNSNELKNIGVVWKVKGDTVTVIHTDEQKIDYQNDQLNLICRTK